VPILPTRSPRREVGAPREPAQFTSCPISASTMVVTAEGEVDACNARGLAESVESSLGSATRLIVDLRDLQFFGTQGFSTLHTVNVTCSRGG
jgi:anti-anti-sigma factor